MAQEFLANQLIALEINLITRPVSHKGITLSLVSKTVFAQAKAGTKSANTCIFYNFASIIQHFQGDVS